MATHLRQRGSPSCNQPVNSAVGVQAQSNNDTNLRIVLLGKTGVGKSSTGNTILGANRFESRTSLNSVTERCSVGESFVQGRYVSVLDTPGFFDISIPEEQLAMEIARSVFESAPGAHAFLFILPLNRITKQEKEVLTEIQNIFGEGVLKYLIILFTNGGDFEMETFDSEVNQHIILGPIVQSCRGYHVFNNKDQTNREQVTVLLQKIDTMIEQNGGGHYSNQMYEEAERFRREEEEIIREEERRNSGEHHNPVFSESQRLLIQEGRNRESRERKEGRNSESSDRARTSAFKRFWQRCRGLFMRIANRIRGCRENSSYSSMQEFH